MKVEEGAAKRFALLMAARDSDYVKKIYGGYYNVFVSTFGDNGERWDMYRVVDGEFPSFDQLHLYDGFVISGSPSDAHGSDLWVLKLCLLLRTLDAMHKRVLGICFGHQVLCRALGGKVGKAYGGWDIGVREVRMVQDLPRCRFLSDIEDGVPSFASIIEIHQDEVWEIPPGAEVIGFSERTGVEMFFYQDHVLGIQGHPEYSKDILCSIIDRLVNNNIISGKFANEAMDRLAAAEPDRQFWVRICKNFLKASQAAAAAAAPHAIATSLKYDIQSDDPFTPTCHALKSSL